jgi:hypothetical protein
VRLRAIVNRITRLGRVFTRNSDLLQYVGLQLNFIAIIDILEIAIAINWGVRCNFLQLI